MQTAKSLGSNGRACPLQSTQLRSLPARARASRRANLRTTAMLDTSAPRSGPTGLDVFDENGKAFRPTSPGGWGLISTFLKRKEIKFVSPQELIFAQERGATILDIRPEGDHKKGHIQGSVNVEYYRLIKGWSAWQNARRAMFTFFGVVGTEPNPNFAEEALEAADPDQPIILTCTLGGNLDPEYKPSKSGMQSRSLMAAYELYKNGFSDISVLKGGISDWTKADRELYENY